jgi:hypothetical protein
VVGVVRRDDSGLRMIQAALGDVRADAEFGDTRAPRSLANLIDVGEKGGELLRKDSFGVFWVLAALAQVPLGEVLDQCRYVVGIPGGRHLDGSSRPRGGSWRSAHNMSNLSIHIF